MGPWSEAEPGCFPSPILDTKSSFWTLLVSPFPAQAPSLSRSAERWTRRARGRFQARLLLFDDGGLQGVCFSGLQERHI